jgi:hypothetical protein
MKTTHRYTDSGQQLSKMQITFDVTGDLIEYAIYFLVVREEKLTKAAVKAEVKEVLRSQGAINWKYDPNMEEESYEIARSVSRDMYPEYFTHEK